AWGTPVRDRLPVAVDQLDLVEQVATGGVGDVRQRPDLREQAGRDGRVVLCALDDLLGGDDRGGVAVGSGEDVVEGVVDRVGEDVGAADHRYAEHDRQRGQDRAGLASEQSFECDGN